MRVKRAKSHELIFYHCPDTDEIVRVDHTRKTCAMYLPNSSRLSLVIDREAAARVLRYWKRRR